MRMSSTAIVLLVAAARAISSSVIARSSAWLSSLRRPKSKSSSRPLPLRLLRARSTESRHLSHQGSSPSSALAAPVLTLDLGRVAAEAIVWYDVICSWIEVTMRESSIGGR